MQIRYCLMRNMLGNTNVPTKQSVRRKGVLVEIKLYIMCGDNINIEGRGISFILIISFITFSFRQFVLKENICSNL